MPDAETEMSLSGAVAEARVLQAPLADRLQHFTALLEHVAPRYARHYRGLVERLVAAKSGKRAPKAGDAMPDFVLPDADARLVTLSQLVAEGPLVLSFNRGHWCEFCRLELGALSEVDGDIGSLGGTLVSVMPDASARIARLRSEDRIPFRVLRDTDNALALSIGLAIAVDAELAAMMRADGIDLAEAQGGTGCLLPIPATFVIGRDKRVVAAHVDADFRVRLSTEAILAALRACP